MRVFVHAGLNKTGSTSLQAYLANARAGLAGAGVIYPDLGADNHWRLVTELLGEGERRGGYLTKLKAEQGSAGALDVLADAIRQCRDDGSVLLLSHENFSVRERLVALERFVTSVDPGAELIVLAYCREPVPLYQSSVQHNLRRTGSYPDLAGWKSGHVARARRLHTLLGERLLLRCFARSVLREGDVVEDFRAWFLAAAGRSLPPAAEPFQRNVALSVEGCGLILETKDEPRSAEAAAHVRLLIGEFDEAQAGTTKLVLSARFADPIRADNARDWNAVVDLLTHPDAEKLSLRVDEAPTHRARPKMFDRWLRAQVTRAYRDGFRAFVAERAQAEAPGYDNAADQQARSAASAVSQS